MLTYIAVDRRSCLKQMTILQIMMLQDLIMLLPRYTFLLTTILPSYVRKFMLLT